MWLHSHDHDQVAGPGPQSGHVKYPGLASSSQGVTAGPREIWPDCPILLPKLIINMKLLLHELLCCSVINTGLCMNLFYLTILINTK